MIPSDLNIRQKALDPTQSFIVQAPAGSGKTELLIQRYLKLLGGVSQPEEILAMTFTRKAAGEMKIRIISALNRAQVDTPPDEDHQRTTWNLARVALERNQKFGWRLLENPARLRVVTIDSFCAFLTKRTPMLSRMGGPAEIQENIQDLFVGTAKQILSKVENTGDLYCELVRALLVHLDNDKNTFIQRIAQLLQLRDQWMISFFDKYENIKEHLLNDSHREKLVTLYSELIEKQLKTACDLFPEPLRSKTVPFAMHAGMNLAANQPDNSIASLKSMESFPLPEVGNLNKWKGLANLLLTAEGKIRKKVDKNLGFPPEEKEIKSEFKDFLESLKDFKDLEKALGKVKTLPSPHFNDYEWDILRSTLRLLPEIESNLRKLLQENKISDFSEVSLAALKSFGNDMEATDLGKYLDDKIQHILVDEYQDTSFKQEELLKKLTAEWEPGKGRTLFVVGDPKQSIYRFRDAEVGLFLKTQNEGIGNLDLKKLSLESNFRSQEGLVDWVNQCFEKILPEQDNPDSGAIAFSKSTAVHPKEPYPGVVLHPLDPEENSVQASRAEARKISQTVQSIRRGSPEATTAILVRGRTHLKEIIREFENLRIPYQAEEIYNLTDRPAIKDLLSLLRALLFPLDRIAWLAILRAPWAGLTLNDIHLLCENDPEAPVWELINIPDLNLSEKGKVQIERLISVLSPTLKALPSNNFRELLENCWIRLGGPACHEGTPSRDIETFFDEVERIMQKSDAGRLEHFNQVIENLHASPLTTSENAIQIMTMHKAKGLEFDYVILPGLGKPPRQDRKRLVFWMPYGKELLLAPIEEKGAENSPLYNFLSELDKEKDRHEMLRLLYVASTRARKQLHLFGKTKVKAGEMIPESNSLLESLWPFIKSDWCRTEFIITPLIQGEKDSDKEAITLKRIPETFQLPNAIPAIEPNLIVEIEEEKETSPFIWAGNTARCLGIVLHRIFQSISIEGIKKWSTERTRKMAPQIRAALLGEGLPFEQAENALKLAIEGINNTLIDPRGRWILSNHDESQAEYPVTFSSENRFIRNIIDRTFVEDEIRWIIDYKTSRHEGESLEIFLNSEVNRYKPQLDRYESLLKDFGEFRQIKKALYFPLLKAWREV